MIYRGIKIKIDGNFIKYFNPKGSYAHGKPTRDGRARYGRDSAIQSLPEGFKGDAYQLACRMVDRLYDRMEFYKKMEEKSIKG